MQNTSTSDKKAVLFKIIIIGIVLFIFSYFVFTKFGNTIPGKNDNNTNNSSSVVPIKGNSTMEEAYK